MIPAVRELLGFLDEGDFPFGRGVPVSCLNGVPGVPPQPRMSFGNATLLASNVYGSTRANNLAAQLTVTNNTVRPLHVMLSITTTETISFSGRTDLTSYFAADTVLVAAGSSYPEPLYTYAYFPGTAGILQRPALLTGARYPGEAGKSFSSSQRVRGFLPVLDPGMSYACRPAVWRQGIGAYSVTSSQMRLQLVAWSDCSNEQ